MRSGATVLRSPFSVTLCQDIRAWLLVFHGRERWEDEEEEDKVVEIEEVTEVEAVVVVTAVEVVV